MQKLLSYKEKNTTEFKAYKEKLDNLVTSFSMQIETTEKNMKNFTSQLLNGTEANFKREYENIDVKIGNMRMENNKYCYQLQKNANELATEKEKLTNIQAYITVQLDDTLTKCKELNKNTVDNFSSIKADYLAIQSKFIELSEFIKDVRFRRNLGVEVSKNELKKLAKNITNDKKGGNINELNNRNTNDENSYKQPDSFKNNKKTSSQIDLDANDCDSDGYDVGSYVKEYIRGKSDGVLHKDVCNKAKEKAYKKFKMEDIYSKEHTEVENSLVYNTHKNSENKPDNICPEAKEQPQCNKLDMQDIQDLPDSNNKIIINQVIKNLDLQLEDKSDEATSGSIDVNKPETDKTNLKKNKLKDKLSSANIKPVDQRSCKCSHSNNSKFKESTENSIISPDRNLLSNKKNNKSKNFINTKMPSITENQALTPEDNSNSKIKNKTNPKKFKERFPTGSSKNLNSLHNKNWQIEKLEKEDLVTKSDIAAEINSLASNMNINSGASQNKDLTNILSEFNENFFSFKKDLMKKICISDQKINQLEYFSKKKLEELANQIKNFIPISFNPYVKDLKEKIPENANGNTNSSSNNNNQATKINQLNVENLIINETFGGTQNFALNVVDTSNFKLPINNLSKKQLKTINLSKPNADKNIRNESAKHYKPQVRETGRK